LCMSSCGDDALGYTIWRKEEPIVPSFEMDEKDKKDVVQSA